MRGRGQSCRGTKESLLKQKIGTSGNANVKATFDTNGRRHKHTTDARQCALQLRILGTESDDGSVGFSGTGFGLI